MYSERILERLQNPKYAGGLRGASGTGKAGENEQGDIVKIYILVDENEKIQTAKFKAYGRISTIVACDIACELIQRKTLSRALEITSQDILEEMGDLPESKLYSATLAEEAVKNAVEDYYKKQEKLDN